MWVQLLIPRIEDGNNFGVSIQEETVAELRTVEGEAASYLDQISRFVEVLTNITSLSCCRFFSLFCYNLFLSLQFTNLVLNCLACLPVTAKDLSVFFTSRYYITRAKLVSKIAKYPHVVSEYYLKRMKAQCRRY